MDSERQSTDVSDGPTLSHCARTSSGTDEFGQNTTEKALFCLRVAATVVTQAMKVKKLLAKASRSSKTKTNAKRTPTAKASKKRIADKRSTKARKVVKVKRAAVDPNTIKTTKKRDSKVTTRIIKTPEFLPS